MARGWRRQPEPGGPENDPSAGGDTGDVDTSPATAGDVVPSGAEGDSPPAPAPAKRPRRSWPWTAPAVPGTEDDVASPVPASGPEVSAEPPAAASFSEETPAQKAARRRLFARQGKGASSAPEPGTETSSGPEGTDNKDGTDTAPGVMAGAPILGGLAGGGEGGNRWGRWLGSKQVAAVVLLLLAAEIAYVVDLNTSSSSNTAAPPVQSTLGVPSTTTPSTTLPPPSVPSTTVAPPTKAASSAPATTPASLSTTQHAAPIGYCTVKDLDFVTVTNSSSYAPGSTVDITMRVTDVNSCIFQPVAVGAAHCPTYVVVGEAGNQVFPSADRTESCDPPPAQSMNPGSSDALSVTWSIPADATAASDYQAVGEWGWSAGSGAPPYTLDVGSGDFAVS